MGHTITFTADDRLLVWAPHPDDESLACGGLIQRTLAAGGDVQVIFVTDGESNHWPQRRAEGRWRLGADAKQRWARRRRVEAAQALSILGVGADAVHFLGWPDQGVSGMLAGQATTLVDTTCTLLRQLQPTRMATPSLRDSHPDHSAAALVLELALRREHCVAEVLCYDIHGTANVDVGERSMVLALDDGELERKRTAVLMHASQTQFGLGRLLRFVTAREVFVPRSPQPPRAQTWRWRFRLPLWRRGLCAPRLQVLAIGVDGGLRHADFALRGNPGVHTTRRADGMVEIRVAPCWPDVTEVFAKVCSSMPPQIVFDAEGWAMACLRSDAD